MAKYQIWGFVYLADKNGNNVITNTKDESDTEFNIPCFNGFAYFKVNNKPYIMRYPKIQSLTSVEKGIIEDYCGYEPNAGEYGVIAGALGQITECSYSMYEAFCNTFPIKQKDMSKLGSVEG